MKSTAIRFAILLALGVCADRAHHLWRILFLVLLVLYLTQWIQMRGYAVAVEIHRRQRHRFANQLQVISGWIQLGRVDRAERYLTDVALVAVQQGSLGKMPLRWAYALVRLDALAERHGTLILWEAIDTVAYQYRMLWSLDRTVRHAVLLADGNPLQVTFSGSSFELRVDGIKRLPSKHIMGVRWYQDNHTVIGSWGRRQESLGG